jgi:hypothetical protein
VLPKLEALGVIQRASEKVLEQLAQRLKEYPGTVVYELCNVTPGEKPEPPERDHRTLDERLDGEVTAARAVSITRKWLSEQTGREIEFGWLMKLYETHDLAAFIGAAKVTAEARPAGSVLGYMTKVLQRKVEVATEAAPDLSTETANQFGGFN